MERDSSDLPLRCMRLVSRVKTVPVLLSSGDFEVEARIAQHINECLGGKNQIALREADAAVDKRLVLSRAFFGILR